MDFAKGETFDSQGKKVSSYAEVLDQMKADPNALGVKIPGSTYGSAKMDISKE